MPVVSFSEKVSFFYGDIYFLLFKVHYNTLVWAIIYTLPENSDFVKTLVGDNLWFFYN